MLSEIALTISHIYSYFAISILNLFKILYKENRQKLIYQNLINTVKFSQYAGILKFSKTLYLTFLS